MFVSCKEHCLVALEMMKFGVLSGEPLLGQDRDMQIAFGISHSTTFVEWRERHLVTSSYLIAYRLNDGENT